MPAGLFSLKIKEIILLNISFVDLAVEILNPISTEMRNLLKDTNEIDKILKNGELKAKEIAEPVLQDVKKLVGFVN